MHHDLVVTGYLRQTWCHHCHHCHHRHLSPTQAKLNIFWRLTRFPAKPRFEQESIRWKRSQSRVQTFNHSSTFTTRWKILFAHPSLMMMAEKLPTSSIFFRSHSLSSNLETWTRSHKNFRIDLHWNLLGRKFYKSTLEQKFWRSKISRKSTPNFLYIVGSWKQIHNLDLKF